MKQSILLLSACLVAGFSQAQENSSILFTQTSNAPGYHSSPKNLGERPNIMRRNDAIRAKSSSSTSPGVVGCWFDFNAAHDGGAYVPYSGSTNTGNYGEVPIANDSTLYVPTGTPSPFYWWCHGLGTSFDPTSLFYSSLYQPTSGAPTFTITSTQDYYVDSIFVIGSYQQHNSTWTDTLHIDLTYTGATGAVNVWNLHSHGLFYGTTWGGSYPITPSPDTFYNFTAAAYTPGVGLSSGITTPGVTRITKLLNAAARVDTTVTGWNAWTFSVGHIHIPAGGRIEALTTLHNSHAYPLGTNLDSANLWYQDTWYCPYSGYLQNNNDYSTGLVISTEERYHTANAEVYSGQVIGVPAYFYSGPQCVQNPHYAFYLKCPASTSIPNLQNNITSLKSYPNPASNEMTIAFEMQTNSDVTITLTDMLGQVVTKQIVSNTGSATATINTTSFPAGVYLYTVESNGQKLTGRAVIAH